LVDTQNVYTITVDNIDENLLISAKYRTISNSEIESLDVAGAKAKGYFAIGDETVPKAWPTETGLTNTTVASFNNTTSGQITVDGLTTTMLLVYVNVNNVDEDIVKPTDEGVTNFRFTIDARTPGYVEE